MAHKFNLFLIIAACAVVISMSPAWAIVEPTCGSALLSVYDASGYSCQIGDKIFSNFTYSGTATGEAALADTAINVIPVTGPDIGLEFTGGWIALSGQSMDSNIHFSVSVVGGAALIEDAAVAQLSSGVLGPDDSVTVTEGGCGPAPCTPGKWTALSFKNGSNVQETAEATFSTVGSVQVSKDILVNGGSTTGNFASLSDVQDTFSQVPEPRALSLLLSLGLLAGLALRKKLQSARG